MINNITINIDIVEKLALMGRSVVFFSPQKDHAEVTRRKIQIKSNQKALLFDQLAITSDKFMIRTGNC